MGAEEPCAPRLPTTGLDFSASLEMTEGRCGGMTEGRCGGMTLGRYGWRASGPVLARDAREVLRCAQE